MKLHKYNQFLGVKPLNENLDKSKKFLKERFLLRKAANELGLIKGELASELEHGEKRSITLKDFSAEQQLELKAKLRETRITDDQLRNLERDPDFITLRELFRSNLGYLYNFVYLFYVEMLSIDDIKNLYNRILDFSGLMDKMPKKFDVNFIDTNISNNAEVLVDGLDILDQYRKIKKIVDSLTPELKRDYNASPELLKKEFDEVALHFYDVPEDKKNDVWRSFFGEVREVEGKKRYLGQLKRYKTLREFLKAAKNHLKSSDNANIIAFYNKINEANEKFGYLGADIVFDESGILILEVKSFAANQLLNGHTRHCIKDSMSQWDSYIGSHNNKQYYLYDFNVEQSDNYSVIGITIAPRQEIRACHAKNDQSVSNIKTILSGWQSKYSITQNLWDELKPMSNEEIERRERAKTADREIVRKGLSIDQILKYVKEDGANINKNNAIALDNAVEENDLEKVKVILDLGASPNLKQGGDAAISKASNIEMIKLLVSNGAEVTGDVFNNIMHDMEALDFCLKSGLDPNFRNSLPFRRVAKGSWVSADNIGEPYLEAFKLLIKYGAKVKDEKGRYMIIKWFMDYGRIEIMEYLKEIGYDKDFKSEDWIGSRQWVSHSRKQNEAHKEKCYAYMDKRYLEKLLEEGLTEGEAAKKLEDAKSESSKRRI